jgi:hypothetical protein
MDMPDGMLIQRIDRETGCPVGAGHPNATFEYFREGKVPSCEAADDHGDIFNDAAGVDPVIDEGSQESEEEEALF